MLQTYATSRVVDSISLVSMFRSTLSKIMSALQRIPYNAIFSVQFN